MIRRPPISTRTDTLFPYPTPFRSRHTHCPSIINWNLRHPTNLDCIVVFVLRIFGWRVFFVEWNFFVALRVVHVREPHDASHAEIFDAVFYFLARLSLNRSEEHTSELQSLMRISYAVFCLKTKKTHYNDYTNNHVHT